MIVLPTAYFGPKSYFQCQERAHRDSETCLVEGCESFEKQTFRNRCLIKDTKGEIIRLSVPVGKVEHKQLTRDVRISYQSNWQHQHWQAIRSSYGTKPYFLYYEDYIRPLFEKQFEFLVDLNWEATEIITALLRNERPLTLKDTADCKTVALKDRPFGTERLTSDWSGQTWTDKHPWQTEISILDELFEKGPETI